MIVNDDYNVINKLESSVIDNARVVIKDCHMFIVQATVCIAFPKVAKVSRGGITLAENFGRFWQQNIASVN